MPGEERLPKERWKRIGISGSLRGRKSEEMSQLKTSSPWGRKNLLSCRGVMEIEVPHNEDISGGGKK